MSVFDSQFATASVPILLDQLGEAMTLHRDGESDLAITAILEKGVPIDVEHEGGPRIVRRGVLKFAVDDETPLFAANIDLVTAEITDANSERWAFEATGEKQSGLWVVPVIRIEKKETAREGYRLRI